VTGSRHRDVGGGGYISSCRRDPGGLGVGGVLILRRDGVTAPGHSRVELRGRRQLNNWLVGVATEDKDVCAHIAEDTGSGRVHALRARGTGEDPSLSVRLLEYPPEA
jgi:hypothetical protein